LYQIPLISNENYKVYSLIPLPIQFDSGTIILVTPEIEYLALSNDNEKYFTLTENQWEAYKKIKNYNYLKKVTTISYALIKILLNWFTRLSYKYPINSVPTSDLNRECPSSI